MVFCLAGINWSVLRFIILFALFIVCFFFAGTVICGMRFFWDVVWRDF